MVDEWMPGERVRFRDREPRSLALGPRDRDLRYLDYIAAHQEAERGKANPGGLDTMDRLIAEGDPESVFFDKLLPLPPGGYELRPRPEGSPMWWPLVVPAGEVVSQDELPCLLAVARRLRLVGR